MCLCSFASPLVKVHGIHVIMGDVFAFFHDLVAAQLSQDQILFCKKKNVVASKNSFNPLHRGCFALTQQRPNQEAEPHVT